MKIASALNIGFGALMAMVALMAVLGLVRVRSTNVSTQVLYENRVLALKHLKAVSDALGAQMVGVANRASWGTVSPTDALAAVDAAQSQASQNWKDYVRGPLSAQESEAVAQVQAAERPLETAQAMLRQALESGEHSRIIAAILPLDQAVMPVMRLLDRLADLQQDESRVEYERAHAAYRQSVLLFGALVLAVAVAGTWLVRRLSAAIAAPLQRAVDISRAVAGGDLTQRIDASGRNETALLLGALAAMQQGLVRVVSSVRSGAESVSGASAEIAQGNQDLSARTEHQASALEETTAATAQLAVTVGQNADHARRADQWAQAASRVAAEGGSVVSEVVDTMRGISASSRQIADIINVIDGIAFQTNILALNAAVEAARAGEQGRGFAVVAGEVRSLAGRSAEAAKAIKGLIHDSVQRVERGGALVERAGATMDEVVASIRRASALMGEINAASDGQRRDVDRVSEAIHRMDQATQQNAALVEEMAAAAQALHGQARELVKSVSVFQLDAPAAAVPMITR